MLWAGQLTGLIGDSFNYVAVAWLVLQLTGSSLAVGSILATAAVPRGLLMLLGGAVNGWLSPLRSSSPHRRRCCRASSRSTSWRQVTR